MKTDRKCGCGYTTEDDTAEICRLCGAKLAPLGGAEPNRLPKPERGVGRAAPDRRHVLVAIGSRPLILKPDEPFSIGRATESSLTVPSKRVSRSHAVIYWSSGFPVLKNLSEQNATLVNGRPITEHELRERDEIQVGPYTCTYRCMRGSLEKIHQELDSQSSTLVEEGAGFEGQLSEMNLEELLRTFERQRRQGTLALRNGTDEGQVVLAKGRIESAAVGQLAGQKALFTMLGWSEGSFSLSSGVDKAKPGGMKIIRKFDHLGGGDARERALNKYPISKLLEMARREGR
jgi:pSer/pThr/pTyr-binding forkhead associated (FHA) protein